MQLWRDRSRRKKAAEYLLVRAARRGRLRIQQAVMTCWRQQMYFSRQRLSIIAALRSFPTKARSCSSAAFFEWHRVTTRHWTFRRSLHRTLQPLLPTPLCLSLLQGSWRAWIDATQRSRQSTKHKRAVVAWACGCVKRQAAWTTETIFSVVLCNWHGFTKQQASRRRLQKGMVARAQRAALRNAMNAWHLCQQEQVDARRLEYMSACQVIHSFSTHLCSRLHHGRTCRHAFGGNF